MEVGKRDHNDSCTKMGCDGSHFNVSLIVRDKVTSQCPQTTTFLKGKENRSGIEPRSFCLPASRLTARPNRLTLRTYLWRSLCSVHLLACQVRVTAGDSGLCCCCVCDVFEALINPVACWIWMSSILWKKSDPETGKHGRRWGFCFRLGFELFVESCGHTWFTPSPRR